MNTDKILRKVERDSKKEHYHLIACTIYFIFPNEEKPEEVFLQNVVLNVLVMSKDGRMSLHQINRAQEAAQFKFVERLGDVKVNITDVVMTGCINLGVFTKEEFEATPVGVELQVLKKKDD